MAKVVINNTDAPKDSRPVINAMFTELYTGQEIVQATAKTTPVDADTIGIIDSAASSILKKLTWANLKATLKIYFDTLYPTGGVGAWASWTPTFTNFTKGSATINAKYTQIGKTVHFRLQIILAADSIMGTGVTFSLPVTSVAAPFGGLMSIGYGEILDSGVTSFLANCRWDSTTISSIVFLKTTTDWSNLTPLLPMTWAINDQIVLTGTYEVA